MAHQLARPGRADYGKARESMICIFLKILTESCLFAARPTWTAGPAIWPSGFEPPWSLSSGADDGVPVPWLPGGWTGDGMPVPWLSASGGGAGDVALVPVPWLSSAHGAADVALGPWPGKEALLRRLGPLGWVRAGLSVLSNKFLRLCSLSSA